MVIDPLRHPLLHLVSQGAQWIGQDEYPSCLEWADEHERCLQFIQARGGFERYLPRLRSPASKRHEALAEIEAAYFLATRCGLPVQQWEPAGANGKRGEFRIGHGASPQVFVEVKSPGWEREVAKAEGQNSPRLLQPKYIHAEARTTDPRAAVRHAVAKAYPKFPDSQPTLLVINDDEMVPLNAWPQAVRLALYSERVPGATEGDLAEDGCFVGRRYERLGGVGILNVESMNGVIQYRFGLFRNQNVLPKVALPPTLFGTLPSHSGP